MAEEQNPEDSRPGGFGGVEIEELSPRAIETRRKEREKFKAKVTAAILEELEEYEAQLAELVKNRS